MFRRLLAKADRPKKAEGEPEACDMIGPEIGVNPPDRPWDTQSLHSAQQEGESRSLLACCTSRKSCENQEAQARGLDHLKFLGFLWVPNSTCNNVDEEAET